MTSAISQRFPNELSDVAGAPYAGDHHDAHQHAHHESAAHCEWATPADFLHAGQPLSPLMLPRPRAINEVVSRGRGSASDSGWPAIELGILLVMLMGRAAKLKYPMENV